MRTDITSHSADVLVSLMESLPPPRPGDGFATEVFIAGLRAGELDAGTRCYLELLTRKVEVASKLKVRYQSDLGHVLDDDPVAEGYAEALAAAYVHFGVLAGEWKWINTALKMDGGILTSPTFRTPPELLGLLSDVLDEKR